MLGMIKIGDAARRLGITTMELRDSAHRGEIKSARTPAEYIISANRTWRNMHRNEVRPRIRKKV